LNEGRIALAGEAITRDFGPVRVLHDVSLSLAPGEVHALIGENGAGKSTLMKILCGYQPPTSGRVMLNGAPVSFIDSAEAEAAGVVLIHQEFNLAEQLTVEANIFLGREVRQGALLDKRAMRARAAELLGELETPLDPRQLVSGLSVPQKQMVEIAKALARNARVLVMDEPTAVLTARESEVLFRQIARLKAQGVAILYTSHKLEEVKAIADTVTVLRDGREVVTTPTTSLSVDQMATQMVGRDVSDLFPPKSVLPANHPLVLKVERLSVPGRVFDASFTLRRGEVLGFAGLVGSGRTELMEGLVGLRQATGQIEVNGKPVRIRSLRDASRLGLAYLTEDRKGAGLLLDKPMRPNLTLLGLDRFTGVLINEKGEEAALDQAIKEFDIRGSRTVPVGNLSGGNQQKLLLAKTMLVSPEIVIIDEPTRGIDIGTKQQIYQFIDRLARSGKSVIVISSEMAEVIGLCHRIMVMKAGRIVGELEGESIGEEQIVRHAMGIEGKAA
jgi:ribose transport system ATP-binding protein